MKISKESFADRLSNACKEVRKAQEELTEIDSRFGDADHGITMSKITQAIEDAINVSNGGIQSMLKDASMSVMMINGGSAVPLWFTWIDGLRSAAPTGAEISLEELRAVFQKGLNDFASLSKAKLGDKTMMDTLIPATRAFCTEGATVDEAFKAAAVAAKDGAETTKNFVAKFGRARSYGEATLGTADAGAVSMSYFFAGLAMT